jgi:hypothetical protein
VDGPLDVVRRVFIAEWVTIPFLRRHWHSGHALWHGASTIGLRNGGASISHVEYFSVTRK